MTQETKPKNSNSIPLSKKQLDVDKFFSSMESIRKIMEEQKVDILNEAGNSE